MKPVEVDDNALAYQENLTTQRKIERNTGEERQATKGEEEDELKG